MRNVTESRIVIDWKLQEEEFLSGRPLPSFSYIAPAANIPNCSDLTHGQVTYSLNYCNAVCERLPLKCLQ